MAKGRGSSSGGAGGGAVGGGSPAGGGEAASASAGGGVSGQALTTAPLSEFAQLAKSVAAETPVAQRWSPDKVLIADAYQNATRNGSTITLAQFKDRLLAANAAGDLRLSRADAPLDQATRQRSQIDALGGTTFHIIRLDY